MRFHPLLGTALLVGCSGGALASTVTQTSPAAPPEAFECVRRELKKVGFVQTSYDTDELRVAARKFDASATRPDVQFRRLVERVEFQVSPEADGTTRLTAKASTFAERITHRGPTEEQEKTSDGARSAAQTVLRHCSVPVDSVRVPG